MIPRFLAEPATSWVEDAKRSRGLPEVGGTGGGWQEVTLAQVKLGGLPEREVQRTVAHARKSTKNRCCSSYNVKESHGLSLGLSSSSNSLLFQVCSWTSSTVLPGSLLEKMQTLWPSSHRVRIWIFSKIPRWFKYTLKFGNTHLIWTIWETVQKCSPHPRTIKVESLGVRPRPTYLYQSPEWSWCVAWVGPTDLTLHSWYIPSVLLGFYC